MKMTVAKMLHLFSYWEIEETMNFGYNEDNKSTFQVIMQEWPILLIGILGALLLGFLVATFGMEKVQMSGSSMDPILQEGDTILVNKMSYLLLSPSRNDVIVFRQEGKEHNYNSIKRVVGLPGEKIQIIDGSLYINGEKYEEKNAVDSMITAGVAEEEITLESGEYFVLGDNRNQSEDSRYSSVGMVTKKEIVGKAWIRTKPSFGFVSWLSYDGKTEETE